MKTIKDTFVIIAPDSPLKAAVVPVPKGKDRTVPSLQYDLLTSRPYALTLEDLMFETHVLRSGLPRSEAESRAEEIRAGLFAKPYPCMRASSLPKKYGWGVHHDEHGRIALYAVESPEYRRFASGEVAGIEVVAAMRSKRAG